MTYFPTEIIQIDSTSQLPKGVEMILLDSLEAVVNLPTPPRTVYQLTRLHPKPYTEYYCVTD